MQCMTAVQTETLHCFALHRVIWWYQISGSCSFCAWLQFHCSKQRTNILGHWLNDRFVIKQRRHKMRITGILTFKQSHYTSQLPTVIVYSAYKLEVVVCHLAIHYFNLTFLLSTVLLAGFSHIFDCTLLKHTYLNDIFSR